MARARNLKPSIFKNEVLGVADPLLTLLFQGLWCLADCNGVVEDRPLRIKAEIFPYREISDLNIFLTELEIKGFIYRYYHAGTALIEIVNFKKHQKPHPTEKASEWPCLLSSDGNREISDLNLTKNGDFLFKQPSYLLPLPSSLLPITDKKEKSSNPEKPHLLPSDFELTKEMQKYAEDHGLGPRVNSIFEDFIDFWQNIATKHNKRTAKGWISTWQRRIRDLATTAPTTNGNGYLSKTDIMSPDYEMPYTRNDFDSAAAVYFDIHDDGTREKYEQFKKNWLETFSGKGHAHEIEAYESGYKFRERFCETRQQAA